MPTGFLALALLSSIAPQTLAVSLYLLGGRHGVRHAWLFVTGLMLTSLGAGVLVAIGMGDLGIHVGDIGHGRRFPAVYITLGILALLFAGYVLWRHIRARSHPRHAERERDERRLDRMVESSWVAFGVGLMFGMPGVPYALALAEATGSGAAHMLWVIVGFSLITNSWGWIPCVWFMFDRERALRRLTALRASVARHHVAIIVTVLALVGIYLVIFGIVTA